jgi:hypothetical protein
MILRMYVRVHTYYSNMHSSYGLQFPNHLTVLPKVFCHEKGDIPFLYIGFLHESVIRSTKNNDLETVHSI